MSKSEDQMHLPAVKQPHGGYRRGAGRPAGTRRSEPSTPIRVPDAILHGVEELISAYRACPGESLAIVIVPKAVNL